MARARVYDVVNHAGRGPTNTSNHLLVSLSICEIDADVVQLTAEATLRLSNPTETLRIRQVLTNLFGKQMPGTIPARGIWRAKDQGGHTWTEHSDDYPLVVVDVAHNNAFKTAPLLEIASLPLNIGLDVATDNLDGYGYDSEKLFALCSGTLSDSRNQRSRRLTAEDLDQFKTLFRAAYLTDQALPQKFQVFVEQYDLVRKLPENSPYQFSSLVSLVDGILTHAPQPTDPTSSIGRQIRGKLRLLSRRDKTAPDPGSYFPRAKQKNNDAIAEIWKRLYELRSVIAHGGQPNFETGQLADLSSLARASDFVDTTVRMLLRILVTDPQFIDDLKNI